MTPRDVELDIATRYARALQKALEGAGVVEKQARDCANNMASPLIMFPEIDTFETIRDRLILQIKFGMPSDDELIARAALGRLEWRDPMFRDPQQRGQVCYLLCRWIPGSPWVLTAEGYKPGVVSGTGLSAGQRAMILFARDLWAGREPHWSWSWDRRRMMDVATLFVAMSDSPEAIDDWIAERIQ